MRWLVATWSLGLAAFVQALSAQGTRLLVVVEDSAAKTKYSSFWADLGARGYELTYESHKSADLDLFKHGELAFEHLLILPTKAKAYGPKLTPAILVQYINAGGNIILGMSGESSTPAGIASFLLEFDITLPPERNAVVVDHFNHDLKSADEKHDVLIVPAPRSLRPDAQDYFSVGASLAVPRAVGQILGNANPLLTPILRAPATAYSYDPKEESTAIEELFGAGSQLSLVTAFQARNSARLTVVGAVEMFQNDWFTAKVKSSSAGSVGAEVAVSNRAFAERVTQWTFHEIGVLRVGRVEHFLLDQSATGNLSVNTLAELNPEIYRIKNDVSYLIELSEYKIDHLVPFVPPTTDTVQLEYSMLSPFYRLNLSPSGQTANSTLFTTSLKLADQHGVFNLLVNYKRPLMTNVFEKRTVTVRHFAHDEWPRSFVISAAYPWIGGIGVTVLGWLAFVAVWLFSSPRQVGGGGMPTPKKVL